MASGKGAELKVGIALVLSVALIAGFFLILGNFKFGKDFLIHVDFNNTMGMRSGAAIRVNGISAGKVRDIVFHEPATENGKPVPAFARVTLALEPGLAASIRVDSAQFRITTKGMLGEPYVEIDPGRGAGASVQEGGIFSGEPVYSQSALFSSVGALAGKTNRLFSQEEARIKEIIDNTVQLTGNAAKISETLEKDLPALMERSRKTLSKVDVVLDQAAELEAALQTAVGDGSELAALSRQSLEFVELLNENGQPLAADGRRLVSNLADMAEGSRESVLRSAESLQLLLAQSVLVLGDLRKTLATVSGAGSRAPELLDRIDRILASLEQTGPGLVEFSRSLPGIAKKTSNVVEAVEAGKGSLGMLVMDRNLYDDLREFMLDLKRRPWRVLQKE